MAFSGNVSGTTFNALKVVDHAFRRCRLPAQAITGEMQSYALDSLYLLLSELANIRTPSWCIDYVILPMYQNQQVVTLPLGTVDVLNLNYRQIQQVSGATTTTSFTAAELENLALWDTTLGGSVGTIAKGTTTASGQTITITWTGDKYHYIVFNSSLASLTNITTGGFGVLGSFTLTTVGSYKVYRSNTLQAGGAGQSITYVLT